LLVLLAGLLVLSFAPSALGADIATLIDRLKNGGDFRVRVAAALELGKTKSAQARVPLEDALDDDNASVRAAAAAGLKALGDKRAIPALERHQKDESAAVRSQVKSSLAALRAPSTSGGGAPTVLVKIGRMKNGKEVRSKSYLPTLESKSREKFGELPGVAVVDDAPQNGKKVPMVMVTGQLRKLKTEREGSAVVFSASVEYIVHRMPEQSILGTVSGSASTKASEREARDKKKSAELERIVVTAAIESAVRRAPEALAQASK
jgi:hypothetical protein